MENLKNKIIITILILSVLLIGYINEKTKNETINLKIFHAGSLSKLLSEYEREFEIQHKNIDVQREAAGSLQTIKKVTQLNKIPDIIISADSSLIPQMMYPDYANWTIKFAKNEIVIAYTNKSKFSNEINKSNWYEILRRDNVKFGFSNPNNDPCGYRSLIVIKLAELKYNDKIFSDLIEKNSNINSKCENLTCIIFVPNSTQINLNKKIMIRPLEMELISALQNREIDYIFIYKNVAVQNNFSFVELDKEINLQEENNKFYSKVSVKLGSGEIQEGKAIVYGITIPKNAEHKKEAIEFVKFLISKNEQLFPAIVDNIENVPDELKNFVKQE